VWGIPSPFCEGEERSSPRRTKLEKKSKLEEMRESLEALQLEEQELNEAAREHDMAQQIKEKRATIEELRRRNTASPLQPQPYNLNPTPLDELLRAADQAEAGQLPPQLGSSTNHPIAQLLHDGSTPKQTISEMFLKPARGCGEKIYLIPDFVDSLVPQEQEETLGSQGMARISVTYGPKKPKLESITMQQWMIGNTRIFYTLLLEGKLGSLTDIQHYLAYSIKIMELANKYEWKSVVRYDNEFRRMQVFTIIPGILTPTIYT